MKDIDEIRRDNLRLIEQECGSPSAAATTAGMSLAQFANLRDGAKDSKTGRRRGMRKETARRIEAAAQKPAGWLDVDHSRSAESPPSPAITRPATSAQLAASHSVRLTAEILRDAMVFLDELDAVLGLPPSSRPDPARLAIAIQVVSDGELVDGKSVVVRLAERLRKQG